MDAEATLHAKINKRAYPSRIRDHRMLPYCRHLRLFPCVLSPGPSWCYFSVPVLLLSLKLHQLSTLRESALVKVAPPLAAPSQGQHDSSLGLSPAML